MMENRLNEIDFRDVAALRHLLAQQRIIAQRFSLPLSQYDAANAILAGVQVEVTRRRSKFKLDEHMKSQILAAARWLCDANAPFGLLMMGLWGNGKTTLMRAIANVIRTFSEKLFGYNDRKEVRIVTAREIAAMCVDDKLQGEYKRLFTEPILAIDDLGEEPTEVLRYGVPMEPVRDLLTARYDRCSMTMATTNLSNPEIVKKYGDRLADRFNEMMQVQIFSAPSYRSQPAPGS